MTYNFW